ncbi:MAG: dTMP kinase [Chloroflexota bacterium]
MPLFIAFEGGERCGKSTQANLLFKRLSTAGYPAHLVYEPGSTPVGEKLRRLLKSEAMYPETELLLFAAARAELVRAVIRPALEQGEIVITDRYTDSTLAYQGYGRGLNRKSIQAITAFATEGLKPELVILLDLPVLLGLARKGNPKDRFESEALAFHKRVRQGYLKLARAEPERWLVVDAALSKARVSKLIWEKASSLLAGQQ